MPYYGAKWAVEEAVRGSGLSHAILRSSFVFAGDGGVLPELPSPPLARDQLCMMQLGDNVVSDGGAGMEALGLRDLLPLNEQLRRRSVAPPRD